MRHGRNRVIATRICDSAPLTTDRHYGARSLTVVEQREQRLAHGAKAHAKRRIRKALDALGLTPSSLALRESPAIQNVLQGMVAELE